MKVTSRRLLTSSQPLSTESPQAAVSLTFDDGYLSDFNHAFPILKDNGVKASFGIISNQIGAPGRLGAEEIKEMSDYGMDIVSHTKSHPSDMRELTNAELIDELALSKVEIEEITGRECHSLLVPNSNWNETTEPKGKPYYKAIRGHGHNMFPYGTSVRPHFLTSFSVESNHTLEEAKALVDLAIETKGWLIFMFHRLVTENPSGSQWLVSDFEGLIEYIASLSPNKLDVLNLPEGINRCYSYRSYQNENLFVNPKFKPLLGGSPLTTKAREQGEPNSISFAENNKVVITHSSSTTSTARQIPFVEPGARYSFECTVEAENVVGAGGATIRENTTGTTGEWVKGTSSRRLRIIFTAVNRHATIWLYLTNASGTARFSDPVLKRI